ncbi:amidase signature enzyme [Ophiobolus disseminans]|uniref:Amidase signature enzyme n=1 Tax=Ophiobolus disseminans TaxID=1469910 RepID=A0A6A7AMV2_9PLEO|nr:amidase signature enzyme [Ophiobolus disseminans]
MASFNRLTTTASELQDLLRSGKLTSADALTAYLEQIDDHDSWLRAVIATPPRRLLFERAKMLDDEREQGKVRGPLHGISVLVKDTFNTPSLGVATTGGCYSLAGAIARQDAEVIRRLLNAGAIVLGKTNLSELNGWKGSDLPFGWSAVGGQCQSPYVRDGLVDDGSRLSHSSCGGSSSGSAVGVAAGFAPISIGGETDGSLNMPATRAALYTIKPTVGIVSRAGLIPVSPFCDSPGPMAKSPRDVADLLDVLVDAKMTRIPSGGYRSCLKQTFKDIKIGALDPAIWTFAPGIATPDEGATKQMIADIKAAYTTIQPLTKRFVPFLPLSTTPQVHTEDQDLPDHLTALHALHKPALEAYLRDLEASPVRTLEELIHCNRSIPEELPAAFPQQDYLEHDLTFKLYGISPHQAARDARSRAQKRIDDILYKYDVDVIIGPADSYITNFAAAAGYPLATLPVGVLAFNGRPFGLTAITRAHGEAVLVGVQSAWEVVFERSVPEALRGVEERRARGGRVG